MLTGGIAAYAFGVPVPFPIMLIVGGVVAIGAMVGDLCESLIKRNIGIKDMGSVIPGHGGLLDRVDALLVTVPLTFYIAIFLDWLGYP
jgi:phosphatidate cytidylyltransferase